MEHPLTEIAPSIEEIILRKCDTTSYRLFKEIDSYSPGRDNSEYHHKLLHDKLPVVMDCEDEQFHELQIAAWIRVNTAKANEECTSNPSLISAQQPWRSKTKPLGEWPFTHQKIADPHDAIDNSDLGDCQKQALHQITYDALNRHASPGAVPPPEISVDESILSNP
jgi:hypothetical protein